MGFCLSALCLNIGLPAAAEERLVQLSVQVTDKRGNFVEGLRVDDFEVIEKGQRQTIRDFFSAEVKKGEFFITSSNGESFLKPRVFFIVVDQSSAGTFSLQGVKGPLKNFLEKYFNRQDSIYLFTDREAVAWVRGRLVSLVPETGRSEAGQLRRVELADIFSDFSHQVVDSTLKPDPYSSIKETPDRGWSPKEKPKEYLAELEFDYSRFSILNFVDRLNALARLTEAVPGEKMLLVISENFKNFSGLSPKNEQRVLASYIGGGRFRGKVVDGQQTVAPYLVSPPALGEVLSHSRTAVYSVLLESARVSIPHLESTDALPNPIIFSDDSNQFQIQGLAEIRQKSESDIYQDLLRKMAKETGGLFLARARNFEESLNEIGRAMGKAYLISYISTNQKFDGKFREIEVKVRGKNLRIRHRKGYYAVDREEEAEKELRQCLEERAGSPSLSMLLKAEVFPVDSSGLFLLLKIEPKGLALSDRLRIVGDRLETGLLSRFRLLLELEDERGKVVKSETRLFELAVRPEEFHLPPAVYGGDLVEEGKYRVRVALKDEVGGKITSAEEKIEVCLPGKDSRQDRLEKVFFVRNDGLVREFGKVPNLLHYEGSVLYPRLDPEFGTEETLDLYLEMTSENSRGVDFYLSVIRVENKQVCKSYEMSAPLRTGSTSFLMNIPLKDFFYGDYILQVIAVERGSTRYSLVRLPFKVVF